MFKNYLVSLLVAFLTAGPSEAQPTIRANVASFRLGSSVINFHHTCFGSQSQILFINLHENESTSVLAGRSILDSAHRYCLLEIKDSKARLITFSYKGKKFIVDPNRIFTEHGAAATLKKNSGNYPQAVQKAVVQMAKRYTSEYIDNKKLVVALHNNTNGGYSISSYGAGGEYANDAEEVFVNKAEDPDNFFYTTERRYFEALKARNRNSILQHGSTATDDGSLSVYCAGKRIPYINIEAELGNLAKQKEMVRMVLDLVSEK